MKREYDYCHFIDNSPMLTPDVDIEITYEDREAPGSGYDEAGFYHRIIEHYNKRKWRFKYAVLTEEEFRYVHWLIKNKATFIFSFCNEDNRPEDVRAYCKPISVAYQSKRSGLYKNLTLEIIEC